MCECKHHNGATCVKTELDKKSVPHKHASLIKAWADGAEIEWQSGIHNDDWRLTPKPNWNTETVYRIKPTPKPDVVLYANLYCCMGPVDLGASFRLCGSFTNGRIKTDNIKVVYDGETGKLKSVSLL